MMGASVILANYVDIALIADLPLSLGPIIISGVHDLHFPLFIGILIDIARLSIIIVVIMHPDYVVRRKKWIIVALVSTIAFFLVLEAATDLISYNYYD